MVITLVVMPLYWFNLETLLTTCCYPERRRCMTSTLSGGSEVWRGTWLSWIKTPSKSIPQRSGISRHDRQAEGTRIPNRKDDDNNEIYFPVWYSQISGIFSQQIAFIILAIQCWTGPSFIAFLFKTLVIIKYFKLGKELQLLHCGTIQESFKLTISSQLRKCMKWLHSELIWLPTLAIIWILEKLF